MLPFEFRTAYFNGDPIHAMKKGFTIIPRVQVAHMAQMPNMFDFPPAPKLLPTGRLDPAKGTESERRGEQVFYGKGQCASCHSGAALTDSRRRRAPAGRAGSRRRPERSWPRSCGSR